MKNLNIIYGIEYVAGSHYDLWSAILFAVSSKEESEFIIDALTKYAAFRQRFVEEYYEAWLSSYKDPPSSFLEENYLIPEELKFIETDILPLIKSKLSLDLSKPFDWPEDVSFQLKEVPIIKYDLSIKRLPKNN